MPPLPTRMGKIFMSSPAAPAAAWSGATSLALSSPSVSRMITLLLASESRRRLIETMMASPMAVPSFILALSAVVTERRMVCTTE
jgi:hypothetical protein